MTITQDWKTTELMPTATRGSDVNRLALAELADLPPVAWMDIEEIQIQPNGHGEMIGLEGLTASIQAHGVLEPLVVTPDGRLLAGRRRLEAARKAGLAAVPVRLCDVAGERAAIEIGLIENVERTDLDPVTRARCYRALLQQGAEVEEIAELVGQESAHVYHHLALLDLHPRVQQAVEQRMLSFGDARGFSKLERLDQAAVLADIQAASQRQASSRPPSSRQIKRRVDAQRVMRLAQVVTVSSGDQKVDAPKGDYAALFEGEKDGADANMPNGENDPLNELNALIAEMIAAAQGEDQVRGWARRLSHILHELQGVAKTARVAQGRLL